MDASKPVSFEYELRLIFVPPTERGHYLTTQGRRKRKDLTWKALQTPTDRHHPACVVDRLYQAIRGSG